MTLVDAEVSLNHVLLIQHEVEQWLYHEAQLLDDRNFDGWLTLLSPTIRYYAPIRKNLLPRDAVTPAEDALEATLFDDDFFFLRQRCRRLGTGMAWSEEPPPRTRRFVTNVVVDVKPDATELFVTSNFFVARNRLYDDVDSFAGQRRDVLTRTDTGELRLAKREILLDQSVVLAKSFSLLF